MRNFGFYAFAALCVFAAVPIYIHIYRFYNPPPVETYVAATSALAKAVTQPLSDLSRQQQLAFQQIQARAIAAKTLRPDERCVGGVVIRVQQTVYTQQLTADGRPAHCSGRLASEPIHPEQTVAP